MFKIIKFAAVLCIGTVFLKDLGRPLCASEATPLLHDAARRDFITLGLADAEFWKDFVQLPEVSLALVHKLGITLWDDHLDGVVHALCERLRRARRAWCVTTYNASEQYVLFAAIKAFFVLNRSRIAVVDDAFFIMSDDMQQVVLPVLVAQKSGGWVLLQCVVPTYADVTKQKNFAAVYADLQEDAQVPSACCVWSCGKRLLCCA